LVADAGEAFRPGAQCVGAGYLTVEHGSGVLNEFRRPVGDSVGVAGNA
jgi:hypothetical protein